MTAAKHDKHSSMNVLTRENKNIWFDDFKLYFEKKKLWNIIEKESFTLDTSTFTNVNTSLVLEANDVSLTSRYFIKFYDDRLKNYHKSNVKIKSKIMRIIIIENYETLRDDDAKVVNHAKTWWVKLLKKYKTKLSANVKNINIKLTSYKLNDFISSATIEKDFIEIKRMTREITQIIERKFIEDERFQYFLAALSNEYMTTRDALNTKSDLDVDETLIILKQKKAQLLFASNSKTAMYAKRKNYNDQRDKDNMFYRAIKFSRRFASRRRRSNSSNEQGKCYLCEEHDHFARECTWFKVFQATTKATNARRIKVHLWKLVVECKNEMFVKRDNKTKGKSDRKSKTYAAKNQKSDTKDSQIEKNDEEKICALFEELHNKILKNFWMKNIDVFSHMIDQLRLFSDNMNVIKRRIIRVEEKVLYSNQCETTIMRMKNDNFISLTNVLYVSRLEVNLLFVKKTCQSDLKSEFNDKIFYLMNKHERRIIEALNKNDVYIVEKLTFNIKEFALASTVEINQVENVLNINNINLKDVTKFFSKNIKLYQLWHRRLEHSKESKIKTLHIVTTLSKVFIVKKHEAVCCWKSRLFSLSPSPWRTCVFKLHLHLAIQTKCHNCFQQIMSSISAYIAINGTSLMYKTEQTCCPCEYRTKRSKSAALACCIWLTASVMNSTEDIGDKIDVNEAH